MKEWLIDGLIYQTSHEWRHMLGAIEFEGIKCFFGTSFFRYPNGTLGTQPLIDFEGVFPAELFLEYVLLAVDEPSDGDLQMAEFIRQQLIDL